MRAFALAFALAAAAPAAAPVPTDAAPASAPGPVYDPPGLARGLRLGGVVAVEALVDPDGAVRAVSAARSEPLLDDEAARRVLAMRFAPAPAPAGATAADTGAVAALRTVEVAFRAPASDPAADAWREKRCAETEFHADLAPRPDRDGRCTVTWEAGGPAAQALTVALLTPDGVLPDTAGTDGATERLLDGAGAPAWPAWRRDGAALAGGTGGDIRFTIPARTWWSAGRVAILALFRGGSDGRGDRVVAWQRVWRIERDGEGAFLVPDPRAAPCLAGPWVRGR